ncbi:MAG: hypothetical protein VW270_30535, partial [Candidatus Poseidoniales archaeon]
MLGFLPIASAPLADSGQAGTVQYTLTAGAATFTLSGQANDFDINALSAESTFSIAYQDAAFTKSLNISAAAGTFTSTGQDAAFVYDAT